MATSEHMWKVRRGIECVTSLHKAIDKAGGGRLSIERMEKMSLMDFMTEVASTNGIRFVFVPEKEPLDRDFKK